MSSSPGPPDAYAAACATPHPVYAGYAPRRWSPAIERQSPWQTRWAYARSLHDVMRASQDSTAALVSESNQTSTSSLRRRCIARWA